jgi:hypothetical protein
MDCSEYSIQELTDDLDTPEPSKVVNGGGEASNDPLTDHLDEASEVEKQVDALAAMSVAGYERSRDEVALRLGLRVSVLDKMVGKRRGEIEAEAGPSSLYPWWDVVPWKEKVDGDALLQALAERVQRHVILNKEQATAVALWILFTWVHERAAVHSEVDPTRRTTGTDFLIGSATVPTS